MPQRKVLFLHGWSSDGSLKSSFLRSLGYDVTTPRLSDWSFARAVRTAQAAYDVLRPDVVVGSSRGAAVAMNMNTANTPLVLLAPAWKRFGKVRRFANSNCILLHSPSDDVVPFGDSIELCLNTEGLAVIPAGTDHRLNCPEARRALVNALSLVLGESPIVRRVDVLDSNWGAN